MQPGRASQPRLPSSHSNHKSVCLCPVPILTPLLVGAGVAPPPAASSQAVHPEGVLRGGVSQHHVGVVEHVQAVQGQRVDLQLVQRELGVGIEADVAHAGKRVGQLLGEAGRRLPRDWSSKRRGRGISCYYTTTFHFSCIVLFSCWVFFSIFEQYHLNRSTF